VGQLLERIIDLSISAGQVSKLAKRLDAEVRAFNTRLIADDLAYLLLDAMHLKTRGTPRLFQTGLRRTRKRVILVAYRVTCAGVRQIIDSQVAPERKRCSLGELPDEPAAPRRLKGQAVRLITTDGGGGVIAGVEAAYPQVARQRCWFHKMQNVASKVRKKEQPRILDGLRAVYSAPTRRAAVRAYGLWARRWQGRYAGAVECVDRDLEELLAVFDVPVAHRRMVRTTNGIERCFREVRRRTRSIGTFVNEASIERIVYGLVAYHNAKYATRICPEFRKLGCVA